MNRRLKLEIYKLFVEDTARFSDRRQAASNIYVAVNTAFVAGVGLLIAEATRGAHWLLLIVFLLLGAGIVVCVIWWLLITRYKRMIKARCRLLEKMEADLDDAAYQMITQIGPEFADSSFSDIEAKLPSIFIAAYSIVGLGIVVGLCLWHGLVQVVCSS